MLPSRRRYHAKRQLFRHNRFAAIDFLASAVIVSAVKSSQWRDSESVQDSIAVVHVCELGPCAFQFLDLRLILSTSLSLSCDCSLIRNAYCAVPLQQRCLGQHSISCFLLFAHDTASKDITHGLVHRLEKLPVNK